MGNILFGVKLRKTEAQVCNVSKRWRWKCHGLGDVLCSRSWAFYTATWQGECKSLSKTPSATCSSFPASISQSACYFHARHCPCHTAKWIKQILEAKNIEIMKWSAQSPDLNPIVNNWKILGEKVMAKKPIQLPNYGRRWKKCGQRSHSAV